MQLQQRSDTTPARSILTNAEQIYRHYQSVLPTCVTKETRGGGSLPQTGSTLSNSWTVPCIGATWIKNSSFNLFCRFRVNLSCTLINVPKICNKPNQTTNCKNPCCKCSLCLHVPVFIRLHFKHLA